jgi:hypothetical protein
VTLLPVRAVVVPEGQKQKGLKEVIVVWAKTRKESVRPERNL